MQVLTLDRENTLTDIYMNLVYNHSRNSTRMVLLNTLVRDNWLFMVGLGVVVVKGLKSYFKPYTKKSCIDNRLVVARGRWWGFK